MFSDLDETFKKSVRLGNDKEIRVEGRGKVAVQTTKGRRVIHDVYYVPQLSQSLLSIGQMMENGYTVKFEGNLCKIEETKTRRVIAAIQKTENNLFPLKIAQVQEQVHEIKKVDEEARSLGVMAANQDKNIQELCLSGKINREKGISAV